MRITRKKDRVKYCEWYLRNVKSRALASEIADHAILNNSVGNRLSLGGRVLGILMKQNPQTFEISEIKRKRALWQLKSQPKIHPFRQTPMEEYLLKQ